MPGADRYLVHLEPVHLPARAEEQHVVVRRADEEVLDVVVFLQVHARNALAASLLLPVRGDRQSLHVAGVRDGDDHVLLGDQVLDLDVAGRCADLSQAWRGMLLPDLGKLFLDYLEDQPYVTQHLREPRDLFAKLGELILDLVSLESRESAQPHLQNGVRLGLG